MELIIGVIVFIVLWAKFKPLETREEVVSFTPANRTAYSTGEGCVVVIVLLVVAVFAITMLGDANDGDKGLKAVAPIVRYLNDTTATINAADARLRAYDAQLHRAIDVAAQDAKAAQGGKP